MDQAIALSGFFLPKGSRIVSTEGRSVPSVVHSARRNPVFPAEGRLIVLIDERSASASEIVSGALQDWDRAVIVGAAPSEKGWCSANICFRTGRPCVWSSPAIIRLRAGKFNVLTSKAGIARLTELIRCPTRFRRRPTGHPHGPDSLRRRRHSARRVRNTGYGAGILSERPAAEKYLS